MWDSNLWTNEKISHPYYSLFSTNRVESHTERTWGVIEQIQDQFLLLMGKCGGCQKLNQTVAVQMTYQEWYIIKSQFNAST